MRWTENRPLAIAALALCVILSVVGLGGARLSRERNKVCQVFVEGADKSLSVRHSMDAYLDSAVENARLMTAEAERVLGASPLIDAVETAAQAVAGTDDLPDDSRYEGYVSLKAAVDKLYNAVYDAASGEGFTSFKLAYDDFWGCDDFISHDEYHQLARSYNKLAGGFPGALVAGIWNKGKLNPFGG